MKVIVSEPICLVLLAFFVTTPIAFSQETAVKVISSPEFHLSDAAKQARVGGTVKAGLTIDKTGEPKSLVILSGPWAPCGSDASEEIRQVREAVKQNVMASRFAPATRDGKPVSTEVILTFRLEGDAQKPAEENKGAGQAPTEPQKPSMIPGGVLNGKALSLPKPAYPYEARAAGLGGSVTVQILIDEQGKVIRADPVDGHPVFYSSVREAACRAEFSPTRLSGIPVKVSGVMTYNFVR